MLSWQMQIIFPFLCVYEIGLTLVLICSWREEISMGKQISLARCLSQILLLGIYLYNSWKFKLLNWFSIEHFFTVSFLLALHLLSLSCQMVWYLWYLYAQVLPLLLEQWMWCMTWINVAMVLIYFLLGILCTCQCFQDDNHIHNANYTYNTIPA